MRVRYPANITRDGKFFLVTFPDVPEAITQGSTEEEAIHAAKDALESALEFYVEGGRSWPTPSQSQPGYPSIEVG